MATLLQLVIGMVIVLSAVGINYYIAEGDTAYSCGEEKVTLCWKLSKLNANNDSTRCYYNVSAPRTYKLCRTGWNLFDQPNITGNLTEIETITEVAPVKKLEFKEFELGQPKITRIWTRTDDDFVMIRWKMDNLKGVFEIPKEQVNNNTFIQETLALKVKEEFEGYNNTFIDDPDIEYTNHPLWK